MDSNTKTTKPQLHQSHMQQLYRCGEKFRRVVLNGEREPSTTPLIVGKSTHTTIARNLTHKIQNGSLLTREAVQDLTRDDFIQAWNETSVILNENEAQDGLVKTKGKLQDQTIALVTEHHYVIAPKIKPKLVERKWVLEAPAYPYDMAGTIDIDEEYFKQKADGQPQLITGIRDTKTRERNLGQKEVDSSEQYSFYALAKFVIDGKVPDYVVQDNLIKPTKTQPAKAISYYSKRDQQDFEVLYRRFDQANRIIKAGIFTPANPSDWWCSNRFCGFAADGSCPYYNSKRHNTTERLIKKGETKNEHANKNSARTIAELTAALGSGKQGNDQFDRTKPAAKQ